MAYANPDTDAPQTQKRHSTWNNTNQRHVIQR
jgi:hypothetical protein